jgi:hypothetical protein
MQQVCALNGPTCISTDAKYKQRRKAVSNNKTDWGFWGFIAFVVLVFWYIWETDTTRISHPDYKPDYTRCYQFANSLYQERLLEALGDPSLWRLAGYESAEAYAEASRRFALARCQ